MNHWAEEEVRAANLEDQRPNNRFAKVLAALAAYPQLSIPAARARNDRGYKGKDEKESGRWLQDQLPETLWINMTDRDGGIYEWFAKYDDCARSAWPI